MPKETTKITAHQIATQLQPIQKRRDENKKEQHNDKKKVSLIADIEDRMVTLFLKDYFVFPLISCVFSLCVQSYFSQRETTHNPLIQSNDAAKMLSPDSSKIKVCVMSACGIAIFFRTLVFFRLLYRSYCCADDVKQYESKSENKSGLSDPQSIAHDPNIENISVNESTLRETST